MSEFALPISEGFLLSAGAMLFACCAGFLSCILKSRCSEIKFCGISIKRDVIPATELNNVQITTTQS